MRKSKAHFHPVIGLILVLLLSWLAAPTVALAQNYAFEVPRQVVDLYVNTDGTITLYYEIEFANQPGADPIDFVDIGLPNANYDLNAISASIDGKPVQSIESSPYVNPGIAISLGKYAIQPGQHGVLKVTIPNIRGALGKSTLELAEDYASIVFTPSWFDKRFVRGKTDYTFTIILPPGLKSDEPRYHTPSSNWPGSDEPYANLDAQGRIYYTWQSTEANAYTEYRFGASFPARLVPAAAIVATKPPNTRTVNLDDLCGATLCLGFLVILVLIIYLSIRADAKRRLQYLPPKIAIEGHGIKRGLTAVEAAILMEQPVDKILTMILFSTIKKGAAKVISKEPLEIEVNQSLPENLQPYEIKFLAAMQKKTPRERRQQLQELIIELIKEVSEKMRGFSRKETIAYYENIVKKAWEQVKSAETPEVKSKAYDEVMDWTMLDRRWEDQTREIFTSGPIFVPTWWARYDPDFGRSGGTLTSAGQPTAPSSGQPTSVQLPKLPGSDFAASMVRGVQNFSASVIGNLTDFTGKITARTNPPPTPSTSTHSRGGSGSCACACACACAGCACACAGGGR